MQNSLPGRQDMQEQIILFGKANVRFIEGANTMGVDMSDTYAYDDVVTGELHLPVNRPVIFKFRSQDVLHSAYFPHFRPR